MFPNYFTMIISTKDVLKFINKGIREVKEVSKSDKQLKKVERK